MTRYISEKRPCFAVGQKEDEGTESKIYLYWRDEYYMDQEASNNISWGCVYSVFCVVFHFVKLLGEQVFVRALSGVESVV